VPDVPADPLRRIPLWILLLVMFLGIGVSLLLAILGILVLARPGGVFGQDGAGMLSLVMLALGVQATCLVGSVYWFVIRRRGLSWADLGVRPIGRDWVVRGILIAVAGQVVVAVLNLVIQFVFFEEYQSNPQLAVLAPAGFSWTSLIALLVLAGTVVPFAEELFFRGFLYGWLRPRLGIVIATVISALCFSVLHGIYWLIPAFILLGVILAIVYQRSGSILAATVTHGTFNTITIILLYVALATGLME
jgi:membrane protease YdiL (CAAX protease family)